MRARSGLKFAGINAPRDGPFGPLPLLRYQFRRFGYFYFCPFIVSVPAARNSHELASGIRNLRERYYCCRVTPRVHLGTSSEIRIQINPCYIDIARLSDSLKTASSFFTRDTCEKLSLSCDIRRYRSSVIELSRGKACYAALARPDAEYSFR